MQEPTENATNGSSCNTLKLVTGKPFGITKIGARIMSIITVGGHEVTRNLSEPSHQTIMHIDVYADYLSTVSPQTISRAVRALLTRGSSKSVRVDNRYTEAYGPHEVMLNIDGINIYTRTMITCDEDLAEKIYVGREELKVRSIGHCHVGRRRDAYRDGSGRVSACARHKWKEDSITWVIGHRSSLECHTNRNMEQDGLRQR